MAGYAVVDVEATGLFPGGHDRIVEVGVVLVSPDGGVEDTWETLLNAGRDLGREGIHGISAAYVLGAPTFPDVAATFAGLLRGRTFVAHNASLDARFVAARYGWLGTRCRWRRRRRCARCGGGATWFRRCRAPLAVRTRRRAGGWVS